MPTLVTESGDRTQTAGASFVRRLGNPWLWTVAGCLLAGVMLLWLRLLGDHPLRLVLLAFSLMAAAGGVIIRFQNQHDAPLLRLPPMRIVLGAVFAVLALLMTLVLIASWGGWIELKPGLATVLWFLTAPLAARAAWVELERLQQNVPLGRLEESAALLLVFALTCLLGQLALPHDWLTLQLFMSVAFWVTLFAAPLTAVDSVSRRCAASAVILFHFVGILNATLAIPPNPWLFNQLWVRIYRPYLEFLYLNNAYHFYSPEPGPASYLWFRMYFVDEQGQQQADWYKVPRITDDGRPQHILALNYQRSLSLTENVVSESLLIEGPEYQRRLKRRLAYTPEEAAKDPVVGREPVRLDQTVPMHPALAWSQQLKQPTRDSKRLLASYARHVAHRAAELYPDWTFQKLRIYRVIHIIPPVNYYLAGLPPTDPEFYHPYYLGEYDAEGRLMDANDPFLYWALPIVRDAPRTAYSNVRDWARKHAGDPAWIGIQQRNAPTRWVREDEKALRLGE